MFCFRATSLMNIEDQLCGEENMLAFPLSFTVFQIQYIVPESECPCVFLRARLIFFLIREV